MPYETPTTGEGEAQWTLNGFYGTLDSVMFTLTVTLGDTATGREDLGDACLQEIFDALTPRSQIKNLSAYKDTVSTVHRVMDPSS